MASDNLNEVGKSLRKTRRDTDYALKKYYKPPRVERSNDIFDSEVPFVMEFRTLEGEVASIDLTFKEPPPLGGCKSGDCISSKCERFDLGTGDHLITVSNPYNRGTVNVFRNGIKLSEYNYDEVNPPAGQIFVQGVSGDNEIVICYTYGNCSEDDPCFTTDCDCVDSGDTITQIIDNFNRSSPSGTNWGTSTSGPNWELTSSTFPTSQQVDATIDGTKGKMATEEYSFFRQELETPSFAGEPWVEFRFLVSSTLPWTDNPIPDQDILGTLNIYVGSGSTGYVLQQFNFRHPLRLGHHDGTHFNETAFVESFIPEPVTEYWIVWRLDRATKHLSFKAWKDGTAEPANYFTPTFPTEMENVLVDIDTISRIMIDCSVQPGGTIVGDPFTDEPKYISVNHIEVIYPYLICGGQCTQGESAQIIDDFNRVAANWADSDVETEGAWSYRSDGNYLVGDSWDSIDGSKGIIDMSAIGLRRNQFFLTNLIKNTLSSSEWVEFRFLVSTTLPALETGEQGIFSIAITDGIVGEPIGLDAYVNVVLQVNQDVGIGIRRDTQEFSSTTFPGLSVTSGTSYWIALRIDDLSVSFKMWEENNAEPATYAIPLDPEALINPLLLSDIGMINVDSIINDNDPFTDLGDPAVNPGLAIINHIEMKTPLEDCTTCTLDQEDTFTREVESGWGNSEFDGSPAWTGGSSVNGIEGLMTQEDEQALLPFIVNSYPVEMHVKFRVTEGMLAQKFIRIGFSPETDTALNGWYIDAQNAGEDLQFSLISFHDNGGIQGVLDTITSPIGDMHIKLRMDAPVANPDGPYPAGFVDLAGKVWRDSEAEPEYTNLHIASDVAGANYIVVRPLGSNPAVTWYIDYIEISDCNIAGQGCVTFDNFDRTLTGTWGTASGGSLWQNQEVPTQTTNSIIVDGDHGVLKISYGTIPNITNATVRNYGITELYNENWEMLMLFSFEDYDEAPGGVYDVPGSPSDIIYPPLSNPFDIAIGSINAGGSGINISMTVGGTYAGSGRLELHGNAVEVAGGGGGGQSLFKEISGNMYLKVKMTGFTPEGPRIIQIKMWKISVPEPSDWDISSSVGLLHNEIAGLFMAMGIATSFNTGNGDFIVWVHNIDFC